MSVNNSNGQNMQTNVIYNQEEDQSDEILPLEEFEGHHLKVGSRAQSQLSETKFQAKFQNFSVEPSQHAATNTFPFEASGGIIDDYATDNPEEEDSTM